MEELTLVSSYQRPLRPLVEAALQNELRLLQGELEEAATCKEYLQVQPEGLRLTLLATRGFLNLGVGVSFILAVCQRSYAHCKTND